jgi:hypothetical protein
MSTMRTCRDAQVVSQGATEQVPKTSAIKIETQN